MQGIASSIKYDRDLSSWQERLCHAGDTCSRIGQSVSAVLFLVLCLSGCADKGPKLSPVSGRVTFQGKPVSSGLVRFSNPPAGVDILAGLMPDGTYSVRMAKGSGLPEGVYAVAVMPPRANTPVGMMVPQRPPDRPDIPLKYQNPSTSGLTLAVKTEKTTLDIDLKPDK
jgi:hypothetical protein